MNSRRCWHWLTLGALMLAAGLSLDVLWIHARVALAQLRLGRPRRLRLWISKAPIAWLGVPTRHRAGPRGDTAGHRSSARHNTAQRTVARRAMATPREPEHDDSRIHAERGNQCRSARSDLVIGGRSSLPWNVPMRRLFPPSATFASAHANPWCFLSRLRRRLSRCNGELLPGFFMLTQCRDSAYRRQRKQHRRYAQPMAVRMAAISA